MLPGWKECSLCESSLQSTGDTIAAAQQLTYEQLGQLDRLRSVLSGASTHSTQDSTRGGSLSLTHLSRTLFFSMPVNISGGDDAATTKSMGRDTQHADGAPTSTGAHHEGLELCATAPLLCCC